MKQAGYSKRPNGRTTERQRPHSRQTNNDTGDGKMRGSPQQCVEKYLNLARDAASSGDPISAENYYQYADHYYRLAAANRLSRTHQHHEKPRTKKVEQPLPLETPVEEVVVTSQ